MMDLVITFLINIDYLILHNRKNLAILYLIPMKMLVEHRRGGYCLIAKIGI
jgi:hypothetical protein